jgi:hypothetical protein
MQHRRGAGATDFRRRRYVKALLFACWDDSLPTSPDCSYWVTWQRWPRLFAADSLGRDDADDER